MRGQKGFTLIEVMIVVVIIGILASIAYPSYREYVLKGNRAEGKAKRRAQFLSATPDQSGKVLRYVIQTA